jgi:hypothetical protein
VLPVPITVVYPMVRGTSKHAVVTCLAVRGRAATATGLVLTLVILAAGCSGGQSATGNRHEALVALQRLAIDENALNRDQGELSQGNDQPCPQGAATLPVKPLTCGNVKIDSAMAKHLKAGVLRAKAQVVTDKAAYLREKGNLPGLPNV